MSEPIAVLPDAFPSFVLGSNFGQWWKVHSKDYGPWFFASDESKRPPESIGRFDLPAPYGTLYVGDYLGGVAPESVRQQGVSPVDSQIAYNNRRLSAMPLGAYYGKRIADFTSGAVPRFGAPADVAALPRVEARAWGRAAHSGDFSGLLYRLREDPKHRLGLALFGDAGASEPPEMQGPPAELPVGLRNEVLDLFDGEYRGDPLPR